ncbi:MAG: hypothetical protein Tsb005_06770 [Gammaproteobacteria bacterium]
MVLNDILTSPLLDAEVSAAFPHAVVLLDSTWHIQWWNQAASELFELSSQCLITDVIRSNKFLNYLQHQTATFIEISAPRQPRMRIAVSLCPYGNQQFLLIAHDVTHTYQLERMRRDFIANVSHELRTPLTVLKGYLEVLLDQPNQDRSIMTRMQQQATRMEAIVRDLLLLSRLETEIPEPEQLQPVNVSGILQAICRDARSLSGQQQHQIELELDRNLCLYGVSNELRSAFSNLIFNAVRYTPAQGTITVRWFADVQGAHLQVQDTGIGIAKKDIPRVTERFYRVDKGRSRDAGGTGLGLAIVKHVLIRHHAELHIQSQLGVGSLFQCDFPIRSCCDIEDYKQIYHE